jgi:hypothetical protein
MKRKLHRHNLNGKALTIGHKKTLGRKKSDVHGGAQTEDDATLTSSTTCKKTIQPAVVSYVQRRTTTSLEERPQVASS